jgi:hypothetical protein
LITEQNPIVLLQNISLFIFRTEAGCVYCAVRARYLNVIKSNFRLFGFIEQLCQFPVSQGSGAQQAKLICRQQLKLEEEQEHYEEKDNQSCDNWGKSTAYCIIILFLLLFLLLFFFFFFFK